MKDGDLTTVSTSPYIPDGIIASHALNLHNVPCQVHRNTVREENPLTKTIGNSERHVNINNTTHSPRSLLFFASSLTSGRALLRARWAPGTQQARACLRTFAHAILSAQNALPPKPTWCPPSSSPGSAQNSPYWSLLLQSLPSSPGTPNPLPLGWGRRTEGQARKGDRRGG